jgi:excisionase family DNA binding protein
MVTEQTLTRARAAARDLAAAGKAEQARAIEELISEVAGAEPPRLDLLTAPRAGELLGVSGQTIKNWVCAGQLPAYRIGGRVMISRAAAEEYVRRARAALDLEELPDDEIVRLIDEEREPA